MLQGKRQFFDPETNTTRSTYENTGVGKAIYYLLSARYPITKNWDISVNGIVIYLWAEVGSGKSAIKSKGLQYSASASTGYRFEKGWRLIASINRVSQSFKSPQDKLNGLVGSSFSITKDVVAEKLSFSAQVTNPFTKFRENLVETVSSEFTQSHRNQDYFRSFNVSLNYNFGKLSDTIKKNKRGIKNDDLTN